MADNINVPESSTDIVSHDTLFDGELICRQYKKGYRFSVDAVLLGHFHHPRKNGTILDIGCGCGIIGLILAYRHRHTIKKVVGLEIQPELAELAKQNITVNGYEKVMESVHGDLRVIPNLFQAESFSSVVCNPPFYKCSSGRKNFNSQERIARHQVLAQLGDIVSNGAYAVQNKGSVAIIYPAEFLAELIELLLQSKLQPKKMRLVYSYPSKTLPARLVLIEAIKNGGAGLFVYPPFYIYHEKEGNYSPEMKKLYRSNKR